MTIRTCLVVGLLVLAVSVSGADDVVISQVYGGGGNVDATHRNDFIELFNRGTSTVSLAGWSVQYARADGDSWEDTPLSGSLAPGQYFLVWERSSAARGMLLPAADAEGQINMSEATGKVALVRPNELLSGLCPTNVADLVFYGGTTCNGTGAALDEKTAAVRSEDGCGVLFTASGPFPRNRQSTPHPCGGVDEPPRIDPPPALTKARNDPPFPVQLKGFDDHGRYTWSASPGLGVASVGVTAGQDTPDVTFTVALQTGFAGPAQFTAMLSDGARSTSAAVTIEVVATNAPPSIQAPEDPIRTVAQGSAPFTVNLFGTDDNQTFFWSATPGNGVAGAVATAGEHAAEVTYTVTLRPDFSGTASFTAHLDDGVNLRVDQQVNVRVTPSGATSHVVISQIYTAGGSAGAAYRNDYVQLFNPTNASVDLGEWSLQYASAAGGSWNTKQRLRDTIGPGQYYLIVLASGGGEGESVGEGNVETESINLAVAAGKVALVRAYDSLSGTCPLADPTLVDFVGYGSTASCAEGNARAPAGGAALALFRKDGGRTDTDVNANDFTTGAPNPRRDAPILEHGPAVLSITPLVNAPRDASIKVTFSEPVLIDGTEWFRILCTMTGLHEPRDTTVAATDAGQVRLITPNAEMLPRERCEVTVYAAFVRDADADDTAPGTDFMAANATSSFSIADGAAPPHPPEVHILMGNPSNADQQPDNYLMVKPEYALSYNRAAGIANWASWHLDAQWASGRIEERPFRPDPKVPPAAPWYRVLDSDYEGTGFDRGHLVPDADRQMSRPINQATFLMTNIIPQAPDNNQGPWVRFETYLRTLLPANEIYIVAGGVGSGGTSDAGSMTTIAGGHVTVPAKTWKVALVLPQADGDDLRRVSAATRTIAVIMPNTQGIPGDPWDKYLTTVDAVEKETGYDFFSNIPNEIEEPIEAGRNGANPPGIADQSSSTDEDTPLALTLEAVVAPGTPRTFAIVAPPAHGTLSAGTDAARTYTPGPDFNGVDSFRFTASNSAGTSKTATMTIAVRAVNDMPVAVDDHRSTRRDKPLTLTAADLTLNDLPGPPDEFTQPLTVAGVEETPDTHGRLLAASDGVTYVPDAGFTGTASFRYTVCDSGMLCAGGNVHITVTKEARRRAVRH